MYLLNFDKKFLHQKKFSEPRLAVFPGKGNLIVFVMWFEDNEDLLGNYLTQTVSCVVLMDNSFKNVIWKFFKMPATEMRWNIRTVSSV